MGIDTRGEHEICKGDICRIAEGLSADESRVKIVSALTSITRNADPSFIEVVTLDRTPATPLAAEAAEAFA